MTPRLNRAERRALAPEIARGMLGPRSPWEHHPELVTHPAAPRGLRGAWCNSHYSVMLFRQGEVLHLQVRRQDGAPVRSWVDLQRIKDELVGPERTAVEVYPARKDLVDAANAYHLWVLPAGLPFGLHMEDDL